MGPGVVEGVDAAGVCFRDNVICTLHYSGQNLEQMLMDALDYGEQDLAARRLAEQRVEAQRWGEDNIEASGAVQTTRERRSRTQWR